MLGPDVVREIPRPLESYPSAADQSLAAELSSRVQIEPFNALVTGVFLVAVLHTFAAPRFAALAHRVQHRHDERMRALGQPPSPSIRAESLHFVGEVEVVFGLWAVVLLIATTLYAGWEPAKHYFNDTVNYTEPLFVVVIMSLAASRPVIGVAESTLCRVAAGGGGTPAAWWGTILTIGPLLGSLITEPAAMTISALLLARQFYDLQPSLPLRYATLGLLLVNVSIGGTPTSFAAPPVLMVARPWGWDIPFMFSNFGWRAVVAIVLSTAVYYVRFRTELNRLAERRPVAGSNAEPVASSAGSSA